MKTQELRRALGLSQAELAALLGTHAMTISRWERGLLQPNEHQRLLLVAFQRAAERGARYDAEEARRDPVRWLARLLEDAYREPALDLGALSATNRFPARVSRLVRGDVMSKLVLELAPGLQMGSVITTDSVDRLALNVGSATLAIVKATDVMVARA